MSVFSTPQQQTQSPFQPQQPQTNPFQQTNLFQQQQQQQQQQPQPQFQQQQFQQPQQQQQHQQQLFLFTNDKTPATYGTKWADLHPDSQKFLLQIEERILEYRDESQRLDQCSRLYDSSVYNGSFEIDASHIVQELGGISTATERQKAQLQELMTSVKGLLWNTEVAVRSFMILRPRFLRTNVGASSSSTAPSQGAGSVVAPGTNPASSIMPVYDFYNGLPRKPSPFLQQTISRFEKYLGECRQWVEELEQLILTDFDRNSSSHALSLLESLPNVMSNVHGFFVHVAAKVESIHQYIESMKTAYLAEQRHRRDGNDPFLEADHRETAKQEAAARRVHPTLHLPAMSQPQAQVAGLIASSAASGSLTALQSSAAVSAASSGGGFSLFTTRSAAPTAATSSSSLYSTPATSTPASFFAPSAASPQSSTFPPSGSAPSMFSNTAASFVPTTPAGPLFSTPFVSGATPGPATGSGASFGPTSKSARGKSRATRR